MNTAANQAAKILNVISDQFARYEIRTDLPGGVDLVRVDKEDNGEGTPRENLLATTDTLDQMHQYIIERYALPKKEGHSVVGVTTPSRGGPDMRDAWLAYARQNARSPM